MQIDISKFSETVMGDIEEIARAEIAKVEDVLEVMANETCTQIKADSPGLAENTETDGRSEKKINTEPDM